jgi:hypothetical protein
MHTNRHRKPSSTRTIARRTAIASGAAVAAVLVSAGGATAATPADAPPFACTGSPLDAFTTCGASGGYGNGVTGGNAGDATGGDTPVLGGGGGK